MVCGVAGCDSPSKSKGYCWMHYGRWRRNGDPLGRGQHGGSRSPIGPTANVPDPAPLQAFRLALEASRGAGVPFAAAWREATTAIPAEWAEALAATRGAWRAAYCCSAGSVFPLEALHLEPEASDMRRSGPPVVLHGARHDGPCELEVLVVPWCN